MSKRCPGCGQINDDSRIFCSACGEPLDAQLRLIQDLEKQKKALRRRAPTLAMSMTTTTSLPPHGKRRRASSPGLSWVWWSSRSQSRGSS